MIHLGLSRAEHDAFWATLFDSHFIRTRLAIKDGDEQTITTLSHPANRLVAGSVQVDATADVTRALDITLLDPQRRIRFEAGSPAEGAIHADRFVAVRYEVFVPDPVITPDGETIDGIDDWVSVPVFWGPLATFKRKGAELQITAQGKESLMLEPYFAVLPYTIKKGTRIDAAIKQVARRMGEVRFDIPDLKKRLGRDRAVHSKAEPWLVISDPKSVPGVVSRKVTGRGKNREVERRPVPGLIEGVPGHLMAFYNGRGRLEVRRLNQHPAFTLVEGVHLTSSPEVTYDLEFRNFVDVTGGKKPKAARPAHGTASLQAAHPLSPESMAWHGKPRRRASLVNAPNLKSDKECRQHAMDVLRRVAREGVEVNASFLPIPMLEENDWLELETEELGRVPFQAKQFTIPLRADQDMTVGRRKRAKLFHHRHDPHVGPGGPAGSGGHGRRRKP